MSTDILNEVKRYLPRLEATQQQFADHLGRKSVALKSAVSKDLLQLADDEQHLVAQLQERLVEREALLNRAREMGLPADSLEQMVRSIAGDEWSALQPRIVGLRDTAASLRRESWVHWIIAHRTCAHYGDLMEVIVHKGKSAPTYDERPATHIHGGAILDASI